VPSPPKAPATIEIKAGATVSSDNFKSLRKLAGLIPKRVRGQAVVYAGDREQTREGAVVTTPRSFISHLARLEEELRTA
jgi:hypothetical protein